MTKVIGDIFDTVAAEKRERAERKDRSCFTVFNGARNNYDNMRDFRKEGVRCHDFVAGRQWNDLILYKKKWVTEYEALVDQGFNPRTTNLINRVVKNVMGVVLKNGNEPTAYSQDGEEQGFCDVLNTGMSANNTHNKVKLLWPQQFKQFLEWGNIVSKLTFGWRDGKYDCWTENIDPRSFFCDTGMMDIRGWDGNMVGMLHTLPLDDVLASFARGRNAKAAHDKHKHICEVYGKCKDRKYVTNSYSQNFGKTRLKNVDFLFPSDPDMCRVIEVWTKERRDVYYVHDTLDGTMNVILPEDYEEFVEKENETRILAATMAGVSPVDIFTARTIVEDPEKAEKEGMVMPESCRLRVADFNEERYWYYRYLTPTGEVLDEGESPYWHKSHPFVFVFYPFVNGEIRSFVADIIEEQKNLNRGRTMHDQIMRISMKGFTAYDKNALPDDDLDGELLHEVLAQPGGSYGFDLKPGEQIQNKVVQMTTNNTGVGLMETIQMDAANIEDISGVNGALQGKPGYSTTSGTLYQQQTQNATGSLLDVIEAYYSFITDCAYKQCSNMLQAYDKDKWTKIAGKGAWEVIQAYMSTVNEDALELDFKMIEGPESPAYRAIAWDFLQNWLQMGFIDFDTMLEASKMPLGDKVKEGRAKANAMAMAQGGQPLPNSMPQQNVQASVAGANAMQGGANNAYNRMAETKPVGVQQ